MQVAAERGDVGLADLPGGDAVRQGFGADDRNPPPGPSSLVIGRVIGLSRMGELMVAVQPGSGPS